MTCNPIPTSRPCAAVLAAALGGRKCGTGWMACCPAHEDKNPSLSIREARSGTVLVHCHAGCEQHRVIQALRARGLWNAISHESAPPYLRLVAMSSEITAANDPNSRAERIWAATRPATGTLVQRYLNARGIALQIPPSLRFHPALAHPSGSRWPAMVACVTGGLHEHAHAIHRTFLALDSSGKAPVQPQPARMMLGSCRGKYVQLAPPAHRLMIGEGIETCLAAMQATSLPGFAALSATNLMAVSLPAEVDEIIILADGDDPGEAAADAAAQRWSRQGFEVRIARPPRGIDFNDMLLGRLVSDDENTRSDSA